MHFQSLYDDMGNKSINCDVTSCNYNNEKGKCTLQKVQISCTCNKDNCNHSYYTICDSFCPSRNLDYEMADEITNELII